MNTRLLFCLLWITPLLCQGASFTSYFLNIEALTNSVARNEMRALTSVFTNSTTVNGSLITGVANPSGLIGMSSVNGVATTLQRSDSRQAIDPAIDPTFTGSWTFAPSASDAGVVITNSAITQIPATINGFSGTTNSIMRVLSGGTNHFRINPVVSGGGTEMIVGEIGSSSGFGMRHSGSFGVWNWARGDFAGGTTFIQFSPSNGTATFPNGVGLGSYVSGVPDTLVSRDGAANVIQFGADSATALGQTLKGPDGSGTDKVGGAVTITGGASTGTAGGGSLVGRTSLTGAASASSVNAMQDRFRYPAKYITLTDNTIASIITVTLPATNSVGIAWTCTISAGDATDFQSLTTSGTWDGAAKTTTITTVGTPTAAQTALAGSAGTLSVTYTFVDLGSNVMALRVTADSSLTVTYMRAKLELTGINIHGAGVVINEL